jgi:glutamate transport system permease protein
MSAFSHLGTLAGGFLVTLEMTVLSFAGALVLGTFLAVFRISPIAPLRAFGWLYVAVLRNMPLLVLLVLFTFGLPQIGVTYPLFTNAVICMTLYAGAFVCETVRAGIRTVHRGQAEAARALGLTPFQMLRYVVLPPAIRNMVQPLGNIFIGVVLGTSLAAAVGVPELTDQAEILDLRYAQPLVNFGLTTAFYVTVTLGGGVLLRRLERQRRNPA